MDETINGNKRSDRWGVSVNDIGDIFRIDLQKLWEERFASLSFPLLKKALYEQTLFPSFENKVVPRLRIRINLKDSNISLIREILFQKFSLLEQVFASEVFNGKYVKEVDLDNEIKKVFNDDMIAIKIKEILINFYTSSNEWGISGGGLGLDNFIQVKNDKSGFHKEYRIISSAYQKVKNAFIKHFDTMFLGIADGVYEKYLAKNSKDDYRLKIAGVLELLGLGTYEVEGGEYPRIFIRINDPFRIKRITEKGDYLNSMVLNIERRYKRSIKYIDTFFTNMTNEERWDFIESYFLGKSLEK